MRRACIFAVSATALMALGCICSYGAEIIPALQPVLTDSGMGPTSSSAGLTTDFSESLSPFAYDWNDRELFRSNLVESYHSAIDGLPGASIYHLSFTLASSLSHIEGVEEVLYTNTESVQLNEIIMALFPELLGGHMEIKNVTVDGEEIIPRRDGWLVHIPFSKPLLPADTVILHLDFFVDIPSSGSDYYYGIFGYNNGILSLAHAYPTVLVYNSEGWNSQTPDLDGDPLFADISYYIVSIEAPADLTLVASGKALEHDQIDGRQKILIANGPARDFYLAASANWISESRQIGGVTFNAYTQPEDASSLSTILDTAERAEQIFSHRYAPYTYTELDFIPIITSAGGVEYPGIIALSKDALSWGDYLEIIIVHEVAHMWFYNLVGNDTLDQPWLDEAMAQFATWQYMLDIYGSETAQIFEVMSFQNFWSSAQDPSAPIGLPVSAYPYHDYSAIVYGRGPFFIITLREQMGVEAFDSFLWKYTHDFSWDIATTDDFKRLASTTCTCDLEELFREWVYP